MHYRDFDYFCMPRFHRCTVLTLRCLGLIFLALPRVILALGAFDDDAPDVKLTPVSQPQAAAASQALQGCAPKDGTITGAINKNGFYVMTGDFFKNGQIYAVIDDELGTLISHWNGTNWDSISAINLPPEWSFPPGYRRQPDGRSTDNQSQPFYMLNEQGNALLVIASSVEKAGQYYYVLLLDSSNKHILCLSSSFGERPAVKDNCLLTSDSSRVKSEWGVTYFSRIQNNAFVELGSFDDSQPWHSGDVSNLPDDSSNYITWGDKGYLIVPDERGLKAPADYLVVRLDPKEGRDRRSPQDEIKGRPFAAISVQHDKNSSGTDNALAYVFEKFTGLPREICPSYNALTPDAKPLPDWPLRIEGTDADLVQLLVPPKQPTPNRLK